MGPLVTASYGLGDAPPEVAIPGARTTPRPREPKPTPGTVAFPLAPLQCRSSIYTTSGAENPHPPRLVLMPGPVSSEAVILPLRLPASRHPTRSAFRAKTFWGKSSTTQLRWLTGRHPSFSPRNLRLISKKYGALFREVNHTNLADSFCKLWKAIPQAACFARPPRFPGKSGSQSSPSENNPNPPFHH